MKIAAALTCQGCGTDVVVDFDHIEYLQCPKCHATWDEDDKDRNALLWEQKAIEPAEQIYKRFGPENGRDKRTGGKL